MPTKKSPFDELDIDEAKLENEEASLKSKEKSEDEKEDLFAKNFDILEDHDPDSASVPPVLNPG